MATTITRAETGGSKRYDEMGHPIHDYAKCGHCGRIWDDAIITSITPTPAGRCAFEYEHHYPQSAAEKRRVLTNEFPPSRAGDGRPRTRGLLGRISDRAARRAGKR